MASIELWKDNVPQNVIRQLNMSKATLERILASARANPAVDLEAEQQ